jgi:hypothetical protein
MTRQALEWLWVAALVGWLLAAAGWALVWVAFFVAPPAHWGRLLLGWLQ